MKKTITIEEVTSLRNLGQVIGKAISELKGKADDPIIHKISNEFVETTIK